MNSSIWLLIQMCIVAFAVMQVIRADRKSPGRLGFLLASCCFAAWLCVGYLAQGFSGFSEMLSQMAVSSHFSLGIVLAATSVHALLLAMRSREIAQGRYWMLQANMLIAAILTLSIGSAEGTIGDIFTGYAVLSVLSFVYYGGSCLFQAYQEQENEFLKFRSRWFLATTTKVCLVLALICLATPSLATAAHLGELMGIGACVAGSQVLADGPRMYLEQSIRQLLNHPSMADEQEVGKIQGLIGSLSQHLESGESLALRIEMPTQEHALTDVSVNALQPRLSYELPEDYLNASGAIIPAGWLEGMEATRAELVASNRLLRERAGFLMQELKRVQYSADQETQVKGLEYVPAVEIQNAEETSVETGLSSAPTAVPVVFDHLVSVVEKNRTLVLQGASVNKATEAIRRIHTELSDSSLAEVSCVGLSTSMLSEQIDHLLHSTNAREGLALYAIENLTAEDFILIGAALSQIREKSKLLYLHGTPEMLLENLPLDYYDYYPLRASMIHLDSHSTFGSWSKPSTDNLSVRPFVLYFLRKNHYSLSATAQELGIQEQELVNLAKRLEIPSLRMLQRGQIFG